MCNNAPSISGGGVELTLYEYAVMQKQTPYREEGMVLKKYSEKEVVV